MPKLEINLNEWERKFDNHEFADPHVSVQIEAGWYDWFCKDTSLRNKTKSLGKKVKQIMKSPKVSCENSYVFFKNNCPMNGPFYDSFSIWHIETGNIL